MVVEIVMGRKKIQKKYNQFDKNLDCNIFFSIISSNLGVSRAGVYQRYVKCNFFAEIEHILLNVWTDLQTLLVIVKGCGQETQLVHGPAEIIVNLLAVSSEAPVCVEEGAGLHHQTVLLSAELLTSHVAEGEAEHERHQGVVTVRLEG